MFNVLPLLLLLAALYLGVVVPLCILQIRTIACTRQCEKCHCGIVQLIVAHDADDTADGEADSCDVVIRRKPCVGINGYYDFRVVSETLADHIVVTQPPFTENFCTTDTFQCETTCTLYPRNDSTLTNLTSDVWYDADGYAMKVSVHNVTGTHTESVLEFEYRELKRRITKCVNRCAPNQIEYNCHCYWLEISTSLTWWTASSKCRDNGATLVSITDELEMRALKTAVFFKWYDLIVKPDQKFAWIFIGLQRDQTLLWRHEWPNNSSQVFSRWYHPGYVVEFSATDRMFSGIFVQSRLQPSNILSEICTVMYVSSKSTHRKPVWVKIPCNYKVMSKIAYICERSEETPAPKLTIQNATLVYGVETRITHCSDGWVFVDDRCYMIFTSTEGADVVGYTRSCAERGYADARNCHSIEYLFYLWKHHPLYGDIFCGGKAHSAPLSYTDHLDSMIRISAYSTPPSSEEVVHSFEMFEAAPGYLCEAEPVKRIIKCKEHQYQCESGECILTQYLCDLKIDCRSHDDEENCPDRDQYECKSGQTISWSGYCDRIADCDDGSEEVGCIYSQCKPYQFTCSDGKCIEHNEVCYGTRNCVTSAQGEFNCSACEGILCYNGLCLADDRLRDLIPDCQGNGQEDELISVSDVVVGKITYVEDNIFFSELTPHPYCEEDYEVRCHLSGPKCYARSEVCIYDELDPGVGDSCRDGAHLEECSRFTCPGYFKCYDSYCLPVRRVCDSVRDCPLGEDEEGCDSPTAVSGRDTIRGHAAWQCINYFHCKYESFCVDQKEVCDGITHCNTTKDDEKFCDVRICHENCVCDGYLVICKDAHIASLKNFTDNTRYLKVTNSEMDFLSLSLANFALLGFLDLSSNNITSVGQFKFGALQNVLHLNLSNNSITHLQKYSFKGLTRLWKLDLTDNKIMVIERQAFYGLMELSLLDLSQQDLVTLYNGSFVGLNKIRHLNLSFNRLVEFPDGVMDAVSYLSSLDLRKNDIEQLPPDFLKITFIERLYTDSFKYCCAVTKLYSNVDQCYPPSDQFSSCSDLMASTTLRILVWLLGTMALTGNIFVVAWRILVERHRNVSNFFIINLSVSDLLMGVYLYIIASADLHYRDKYYHYAGQWTDSDLCKFAGILNLLSSEVSVYMLVLISFDRFIAIVLTFETSKLRMHQAIILTATGWLIGLIVCLLPLMGHNYFTYFYNRSGVCMAFSIDYVQKKTDSTIPDDDGYGMGYSYGILLFNFLSFIMIAALYTLIYCRVRQISRATKGFSSTTHEKNTEVIVAKKLVLVIITDFLCWMPVILIKFISWLGHVTLPAEASAWIAVFLLPLNSSLNPFIYTISMMNTTRRRKKQMSYASKRATESTVSTVETRA